VKAKTLIGLTAMLAGLVVLLAGHWSSGRAQPVASITLPPPGAVLQLYPGCNNIGVTFSDGTPSGTVLDAVSPAGSVEAMWRHDAAQQRWEGFSAAAPEASDLLTVNFLDAIWLCLVGGPPTATPTATTPTTPGGQTATPTSIVATPTTPAGQTAIPTSIGATPTTPAGQTATPVPTSAPATVTTAVAPSDVLTSFHYTMQVSIEADGMPFTISSSGDFEAPSVSCAVTLSFFGSSFEAQVVVIPPNAWINVGDKWTPTTPDDPNVLNNLDLCPGSSRFWEGFLPLDVGSIEQHSDSSKGVPAVRLSLKGVVPSIPFFGPISSEETVNTFDIWVAQSGGWLVALQYDATETADEGGTVEDRMQVNVTRPNDPTIHVVKPIP
jgi:hypothetical protein